MLLLFIFSISFDSSSLFWLLSICLSLFSLFFSQSAWILSLFSAVTAASFRVTSSVFLSQLFTAFVFSGSLFAFGGAGGAGGGGSGCFGSVFSFLNRFWVSLSTAFWRLFSGLLLSLCFFVVALGEIIGWWLVEVWVQGLVAGLVGGGISNFFR